MFEKLAHFLVKHRKGAVVLFVVGILVAGGFGSLAFSRLDSAGYSDPNSDSTDSVKKSTTPEVPKVAPAPNAD